MLPRDIKMPSPIVAKNYRIALHHKILSVGYWITRANTTFIRPCTLKAAWYEEKSVNDGH
jgi:hypothetical protein